MTFKGPSSPNYSMMLWRLNMHSNTGLYHLPYFLTLLPTVVTRRLFKPPDFIFSVFRDRSANIPQLSLLQSFWGPGRRLTAYIKQAYSTWLSVGAMNSLSLKLARDFSLLFTQLNWDISNQIAERTLGIQSLDIALHFATVHLANYVAKT